MACADGEFNQFNGLDKPYGVPLHVGTNLGSEKRVNSLSDY